ncbi:MAG: PKD domain-containing protein [Armatimonadota bacterium]
MDRAFLRGVFLSAALMASAVLNALAAPEMTIYAGEDPANAGIVLGGWGSGGALVNSKQGIVGPNSIEVRTDGYYSGARIDFTKPVDVTDAFSQKFACLVLTLRIPGLGGEGDTFTPTTYAPTGAPGMPYGPRTGYPGYPTGPYSPYGGQPGTTSTTTPTISYLRVVMVVNGSKLVAEDQPIDYTRADQGILSVFIPLQAFQGPKPSNPALLERLLVFGDRSATFYLGEIRTAIDDEEITVDPLDEMEVNTGDRVEFSATAQGGESLLEYVWDFDASDGLQEEAYGPVVTHVFRKPGDYTITVTVRDVNRVKTPAQAQVTVKVAQQ